jgi:hypothetical protein
MHEFDEKGYIKETKYIKGRENLGSPAIIWEVNIRIQIV